MTFSSNAPQRAPRTVAYLRVSTVDQDTEKNRAAILALANHKRLGHVEFVEEKVSGTVSWRSRRIAAILEEAGRGDTIIVSELSRLGRSMLECMEILSIATQKGISIYAVKGDWQLTNTIQSKILAMAFSMAAEIERDLISKRTREALLARKHRGCRLAGPGAWGRASWTPTGSRSRHSCRTAQRKSSSPAGMGRRRRTSTTSSDNAGSHERPGRFLTARGRRWDVQASLDASQGDHTSGRIR
jgi:DNA invertase Pin-like site-specific DNA recombinase